MTRFSTGLLLLLSLLGCALPSVYFPSMGGEGLHLSELSGQGDAARRASLRLVLEGLDADAAGNPDRALGLYEQALRVDSVNPYVYLAMARHFAEGENPDRALRFLDQSESLLAAEGETGPRVEADLVGIRGVVYAADGRSEEAAPLLERARRLAPRTWSDGRLSAEELR